MTVEQVNAQFKLLGQIHNFRAEIERLRAAAELARKRLLDVVRNGDGEPEDMEAYEALDRALKP